MEQKIEHKGRNPRITVCYMPDENEKIVKLAAACGLKKSQYIHDTSLGQEPKVMMSDKEADALMSLKAARGHSRCPPEGDNCCLLRHPPWNVKI